MAKRVLRLGIAAVVVIVGTAAATYQWWSPPGAVAQAPQAPPLVPVEVGQAVVKKSPVQIEALGNVTPIASVALKSRVDSEIVGVHFADGASVNKGDLLLTLDSRAITAQIAQADGLLARDRAQLEGAERDLRRYTDLAARNATTLVNLENAKTQVATYSAAVKASAGALETLRVQLSYFTLRAPITGRVGLASVKVGNVVRAADAAPIATIIQVAPVYVSFAVPQHHLPDIREALANETATVDVSVPGTSKRASGAVSMIENAVDQATGTAMIRATMPNADELLWPGTLVNVILKVRDEEGVVVPASAVQVSQQGTYVYVVQDGVARVQPVAVARLVGRESVLSSGLSGRETVVTDGHLRLTNNTRVRVRERKAGS